MTKPLTEEQQKSVDLVLDMLPEDEAARAEALEEIARVEEMLGIKQPD